MTIVAENLVKAYHGRRVVNEVSLRVERGEIVGLLGPNGAGKTTTFYMIVGLEKSAGGRITLDGKDITRLPLNRRARLGIGYLAQESSIFRKLTVEENIRAILEVGKLSRKQQTEKCEALLHEFHIESVRHHKGFMLSGGERRRCEIARALAADPSFILLDEPFAGIDPIAVAEIQHFVAHLKDRGLGVLITDHNVRETLAIVDRGYILHEGKILVEGTSAEIADNPTARQFYLGERFTL
jgi:lipopolysaccharide export system ATP-binding protein